MGYGFLSRAGKFLQEQRKHRRWMMMFLCLAGGVTLGTLAFLKLYGQAMTHQVKVLDCQYKVHAHTEDCYGENEDGDKALICEYAGYVEHVIHVHTEDCYEENEDGDKVLVCEYADYAEYVIHVHNDDCYDQKGNLVCPLGEHELHEHDDDCWEEVDVLICDKEESEGSAEESESKAEAAEAVEPAKAAEESQDAEEESGSDAVVSMELACEKEEHKHDDSCYESGSGCDLEEHTHDDDCYTEELVCKEEEHTHDDDCYSTGESKLTCEIEKHEHDDSCYKEDEDGEKILVCEEEEEEHEHDDGCYSEGESELTCEIEEHEHGDSCYENVLTCEIKEHKHDDSCEAESELICEIEEHEHDDSCYIETEVETKAETEKKETSKAVKEELQKEVKETETDNSEKAEEGHTHTDDCYRTEKILTCEELELHTHDDSCYDEDCFDEDGNLIEGSRVSCGLLQLEEHVHTEECFKVVELTPEEVAALNGGATLHVHSDECYDEEGNLICGHEVSHLHQPECYDEDGNLICGFGGEEKTHEHDAKCYDEEGNLTCGYEDAKNHEHSKACYDEEGNLICGYEGVKDHEHDAGCYDEEGNLICGYEGAKNHEHDANCYDIYGELICGYEGAQDHVHTEACYDEEGNLICGYVLQEEYANSRTFESGNYVVIVKYDDDANIPKEAELLVEEITPDSDKEHYERRETEYREILEDEMASMRALLKIGFYTETEDGKTEIEPEAPVMVSVQFLDEDGLPEGRPVTVIHFAEEGTEMLDGGSAVDNSTTFTMKSFSEIAIGYIPEEEQTDNANKIEQFYMSESFQYEDDAFHITFHVEGMAAVAADETDKAVLSVDGVESVQTETEDNAESEEESISSEPAEEEAAASADADTIEEDDTELPADTEDADKTEEPVSSEVRDDAEVKEEIAASENTEDESNASPAEDITGVGDGAVIDEVVLEGDDEEDRKLSFTVKLLRTDSEEYDAVRNYAEKADEENESELFLVRVMSYALTCNGKKVDLSNCKVTAEVTPVETLFEATDESFEKFAEESVEASEEVSEEVNGEEDEKSLEEEKDAEIPETADEQIEEDSNEDSSKTITDGSEEDSEKEDESELNELDPASVAATFSLVPSAIEEESLDTANMFQANVMMMAMELADDSEINELDVMDLGSDPEVEEHSPMLLTLNTGVVALAATEYTTNPLFTVEYYAYLNVLDKESGGTALSIIDTSKAANGKATLPENGTTPKTTNIYLYGTGANKGQVKMAEKLLPIYEEEKRLYFSAPSLAYMNILADKDANYELTELWMLEEGGDTEEEEDDIWRVYKDSEKVEASKEGDKDWGKNIVGDLTGISFTNRAVTAEKYPSYILITEDSVIRLVYEQKSKEYNNPTTFYDYDISNGQLYRAIGENNKNTIVDYGSIPAYKQFDTNIEFRGKEYANIVAWAKALSGHNLNTGNGTTNNTGEIYTYTVRQGINLDKNYEGKSGSKLAFGNANTGTTLGNEKWNNAMINRHNTEGHGSENVGYQGCAFGLVTGLEDGKIQYNSGIAAPNLFNDGPANGKTEIKGYSLDFSQEGDTYTLTAVKTGSGSAASPDLDRFTNPTNSTGTHTGIWTNNFWPMDTASTYGMVDLKFGDTDGYLNRRWKFASSADKGESLFNRRFPESDDGQFHNSYFGMNFSVNFELTENYLGPLEYYFFGDDDMWVFLDNNLICDIGGTHSSVGEYVNLWDYLDRTNEGNLGRHKLTFFYTERGASGSTCWMQFTLPSVSHGETSGSGSLDDRVTVGKRVDGEPTDEEFEFRIYLKDSDGNPLDKDAYPYVRYHADSSPYEGVESIINGGTFKLKAGERIGFKYLPDNATFTIEEIPAPGYTISTAVDGSHGNSGSIEIDTGTKDVTHQVDFINTEVPRYDLPKTGGPGTELYTIAGALLIMLSAGFLYRKKFRERRV